MRTTSFCAIILMSFSLLFMPGCAATRNSDPRTPVEIFLDAILGIGETDEIERWRDGNRREREKRRAWQRENLSKSERRSLGLDF